MIFIKIGKRNRIKADDPLKEVRKDCLLSVLRFIGNNYDPKNEESSSSEKRGSRKYTDWCRTFENTRRKCTFQIILGLFAQGHNHLERQEN